MPPVECKTSMLIFTKNSDCCFVIFFNLNDQCNKVLWITVTLPLAFNFLCACSMTSHSFDHRDIIGVSANVSLLLL